MSKKYTGILTIFIFLVFPLMAQDNVREQVFVQLSATDLIVGESLKFSSFTYSQFDGQPSDLSILLYVELLDEKGKPIYQTKVSQKKGRGYGEIFLPGSMETGNYHLVAYTRWMRNFDDFFHQRVTILNPYKSIGYQDDKKTNTRIQFYPEGGSLITGVDNKVVIYAVDGFRQGKMIKGKVMSPTGEKVVDVTTDSFGFFDFNLNPVSGQYQFIIESDQGFEFLDLPEAGDGVRVKVTSSNNQLIVALNAQGIINETGLVEIFKADQLVFSSQSPLTGKLHIEKESLPSGLLRINVHGDRIYKRLCWNGALQMNREISNSVYSTMEEVNLSLQLPASNGYSVVINKMHDTDFSTSMGLMHDVNAAVDLKQSALFFSQVNDRQLDLLLLASQSAFKPIDSKKINYLPEYRFGLVQGTASDEAGLPAPQVEIGMALNGNEPHMSATTTDALGHFVLRYKPAEVEQNGSVLVLNSEKEYFYLLESEFYTEYPEFTNPPLMFDSIRVSQTIQRSINNQLENAFFQKNEEHLLASEYTPLFGAKSYLLSDFTRFSSMRDTFIEVAVEVGVSKNEKIFKLDIKTNDAAYYQKRGASSTLLLLDGVFATAEDILTLSPVYVERIDVVNKKYFFGKVRFDGVLAVYTSSPKGLEMNTNGKSVNLTQIQSLDRSELVTSGDKRMPNLNPMLYWNPIIDHPGGALNLNFFTSEVTGKFELKIEGIDANGLPICKKSYFEVK